MNDKAKPIQLDRSKLLGFKLATGARNAVGKNSPAKPGAKLGAKIGSKPGVRCV